MKKTVLISLFLISSFSLFAQSNIDKILLDIEKNNKEILSEKQYSETKKLEFKTRIYPKNPLIEFDYLVGSPSGTGNQTEIYITQEFDFPTVYYKRKKVSDMQVTATEEQTNIAKYEILLEAKQNCIEIIYSNKKKIVLKQRFETAKLLFDKFEKRLNNGDVNILDFNKVKINLLNADNEMQHNQTRINSLLQKLSGLNGNNTVTLNDTIFPLLENFPDLAELQKQYAENDHFLKSLMLEKEINTVQISLAKALTLPKLNLGFHSQTNAGYNFNGLHVGVTIPLWENKNTVKYAVTKADYNTSLIDNRQVQINSKISEIYNNCIFLQKNLNDYNQVFKNLNDVELLDKALQSGQISAIEYLLEISFINQTIDRYLQMEYEYNKALTDLYKFKQ